MEIWQELGPIKNDLRADGGEVETRREAEQELGQGDQGRGRVGFQNFDADGNIQNNDK